VTHVPQTITRPTVDDLEEMGRVHVSGLTDDLMANEPDTGSVEIRMARGAVAA
jgi:hypothetical protein